MTFTQSALYIVEETVYAIYIIRYKLYNTLYLTNTYFFHISEKHNELCKHLIIPLNKWICRKYFACMHMHVLGQADNILQTGSKQNHVLYKKRDADIDWLVLATCGLYYSLSNSWHVKNHNYSIKNVFSINILFYCVLHFSSQRWLEPPKSYNASHIRHFAPFW